VDKNNLKLYIPCLFGLEGIVKNEIAKLNIDDVSAQNGGVFVNTDEAGLFRLNMGLRCAERVYIVLNTFEAKSFEDLFCGTADIEWEKIIKRDASFPVKGYSINSALESVPACQKIVKKAISKRLCEVYRTDWVKEVSPTFQVAFSIVQNVCNIMLDTSGVALHKRGYREISNEAPLRETLAAACVILSGYKGRGIFYDPFCGSGTIAIEAALYALNRAPNLMRKFDFMAWGLFDPAVYKKEREALKDREFDRDYKIKAYDIDPDCVALSRKNAALAGVDKYIEFEVRDARDFAPDKSEFTYCVCNPPYGRRMDNPREVIEMTRKFGGRCKDYPKLSVHVLTADEGFELAFGKRADKKRKLYNGMLKCDLYSYRAKEGKK